MKKIYRAVCEITDEGEPKPFTRREIADLLESDAVLHTTGITVKCIELTEVKE